MPRIETRRVFTALTRARTSPYPRSPSPASGDEMEVQPQAGKVVQFSDSSTTFNYFTSAKDVRLEGVKFYNVRGNLINVDGRRGESREAIGIIKGARVVDREDVFLDRQIYKGRYYRLHAGLNRGKVVMVKTYEGVEAKERCRGEAKLYSKQYHPNIPNLVAVSRLETPAPFLVFQGSYDGPLEHVLIRTLKKGLKESWIMGLKTVAGLSAGLSYLNDEEFKFASLSPDDFVLLSSAGKPVITFQPYDGMNQPETSFESYEAFDPALGFFHRLCEKTFDAARKAHYESEQPLSAFIEDDDDTEEFSSALSLEEADFAAFPTGHTSSLPLYEIRDRARTADARRLELVWKPQKESNTTLSEISSQFNLALASSSSSLSLDSVRHYRRYTSSTAHRCPGYKRVEIALTPRPSKSVVISHDTPVPSEICLVCGEVVRFDEPFNCACGEGDNGLQPTIRCTCCFEWHHRGCVHAAGLAFIKFVCEKCQNQNSVTRINMFNPIASMHLLKSQEMRKHQLKQMHEREQQEPQFQPSNVNPPAEFPFPNETFQWPPSYPSSNQIQNQQQHSLPVHASILRNRLVSAHHVVRSLQQHLNEVRGSPQGHQLKAVIQNMQNDMARKKELLGRMLVAITSQRFEQSNDKSPIQVPPYHSTNGHPASQFSHLQLQQD